MTPPPPRSTLFPYTTLFRSGEFRRGDPRIAAACVVGAFMEALVGPLTPDISSDKEAERLVGEIAEKDRKSTRLNSSHQIISYAVFCLKKKNKTYKHHRNPEI